MYCTKCGKETSDTATFCPYCGAKKTVIMPKMETTVNQVSYENSNEAQVLPVYKRKNKLAFLVCFIPPVYVFIKIIVLLLGGSLA